MPDDLTSCETCGMRWTAHPRELCPRCALAQATVKAEHASRRMEEVLHELEMVDLDRLGPRV